MAKNRYGHDSIGLNTAFLFPIWTVHMLYLNLVALQTRGDACGQCAEELGHQPDLDHGEGRTAEQPNPTGGAQRQVWGREVCYTHSPFSW